MKHPVDMRLVALMTLLLVNTTSVLLLNQYYAWDAQYKEVSIPMIGFVLSCFPFGNIYASMYLGKHLGYYGKKHLLNLCGFLLAFCYLVFYACIFIFQIQVYLILSVIARSLQGVAVGGALTICYSYIGDFYPERFNQVVAYFELVIGVGLGLGPSFGDLMIFFFGLRYLFLTVSIFYLIYFRPCLMFIPDDKPKKSEDVETEKENEEEPISFSTYWRDPQFLSISSSLIICICSQLFNQNGLIFVIEQYQESKNVTLLLTIQAFVYGLTMFLLSFCHSFMKGYFMVNFGFLCQFVSYAFLGTYSFLHIPKHIAFLYVGQVLCAIGQAFITLPVMELTDKRAKLVTPEKDKSQINNLCAGNFQIGVAMGCFIGPNLVTELIHNFSWTSSCIVMQVIVGLGWVALNLYRRDLNTNTKKDQNDLEDKLIN